MRLLIVCSKFVRPRNSLRPIRMIDRRRGRVTSEVAGALAASRLQARYRRLRDAIGTGEIGLHFAIGKPLKGFGALMRGESRGTTETHATGFSTGSAVAGAGED